MLGAEAPEAAVVFGIADHHLRQRRARIERADRGGHQRLAITRALRLGQHGDRADQDHGVTPSGRIGQRDRPALDRADQVVLGIDRRERQSRQPVHPFAQAVGGALAAFRLERTIEQRFDQRGIDIVERNKRGLGHRPRALGARGANVDPICAKAAAGGHLPCPPAQAASRPCLRRSRGSVWTWDSGLPRSPCRR